MTNYTVADLRQVLLGFGLFLPFLLFCGYSIAWITDVLAFRARTLAEKLVIAVPVSISTVPVLLYLVGRFVSMTALWAMVWSFTGLAVILVLLDLRRGWRTVSARAVLVVLLWVVVGLAALVDFQWGDRLYTGATAYDYTVRAAVTDAVAREGVRPSNPFFYPGHPTLLRYHYFWFLPAGLVAQLGGASVCAGQALIAATLWCGLGLMALVVLYLWYFRNRGRRAWFGIALLGITGLDILPSLVLMAGIRLVYFTMDSWNEAIAFWLASVSWVPHHVAAMIACFTGLLVLWTSVTRTLGLRLAAIAVAGASFACAAGLSVYVTFVFAAAIGVLTLIFLWKRWWRDAAGIAGAGVIAIVLALPYLIDLLLSNGAGAGSGSAAKASFVGFTIRPFTIVQTVLAGFGVGWNVIAVVNALLLPLNYSLELGVYLIAALLQIQRYRKRRTPLGRKEWLELILFGVPVLICTFLRSTVIVNNDLGWRGFLVPQFILLLWAVDYVAFAFRKMKLKGMALPKLRKRILVCFWLGLAGTVYGFVLNRAYLPEVDAGHIALMNWWFAPDRQIGKRNLAMRDTYEWIRGATASDAALLTNPKYIDIPYGLYAQRQAVAYDESCGTGFGGSMDECRKMLPVLLPIFMEPAVDLDAACRAYPIRMIVVKDLDPVWSARQSWVWSTRALYETRYSRVFGCPAR